MRKLNKKNIAALLESTIIFFSIQNHPLQADPLANIFQNSNYSQTSSSSQKDISARSPDSNTNNSDKPLVNPTAQLAAMFSKQMTKNIQLGDNVLNFQNLWGADISTYLNFDSAIACYVQKTLENNEETSYTGLSVAIKQLIKSRVDSSKGFSDGTSVVDVYWDENRLWLIFEIAFEIKAERKLKVKFSKVFDGFGDISETIDLDLTLKADYKFTLNMANYLNDPENSPIMASNVFFNIRDISITGAGGSQSSNQPQNNKMNFGPLDLYTKRNHCEFSFQSQWGIGDGEAVTLDDLNSTLWKNEVYRNFNESMSLKTSERDSASTAQIDFSDGNEISDNGDYTSDTGKSTVFTGDLFTSTMKVGDLLTLHDVVITYSPKNTTTQSLARLNFFARSAALNVSRKLNASVGDASTGDGGGANNEYAVRGSYDLQKRVWTLVLDQVSFDYAGCPGLKADDVKYSFDPTDNKIMSIDTLYGIVPGGKDTVTVSDPRRQHLVSITKNKSSFNRIVFEELKRLNKKPDQYNVNQKKLSIKLMHDTCLYCPKTDHAMSTVTDIDGNVYRTILIGNQEWSTENLRTTRFNDGKLIPLITDSATWAAFFGPCYSYYNNTDDTSIIKKHGALYNGYTATGKRNIAPLGWHVPTKNDWEKLQSYLISNRFNWDGSSSENKIAKAVADSTCWVTSPVFKYGMVGKNPAKNNCSGFSILPSGFRDIHGFSSLDTAGCLWSSTTEPDMWQYSQSADLYSINSSSVDFTGRIDFRGNGHSIRIIKDSISTKPKSSVQEKKDSVQSLENIFMKDIEGNVYKAIRIGTQIWTIENLRVTRYSDSTPVDYVTEDKAWADTSTGKYCYYQNTNEAEDIRTFGALYNWTAVNPANKHSIAPDGWHLPTDADWNILENYLISNDYNWDGSEFTDRTAKSIASNNNWNESSEPGAVGNDTTKNNKSGFCLLPSGFRSGNGAFYGRMSYGAFWIAEDFHKNGIAYMPEQVHIRAGTDSPGKARNYNWYFLSYGLSVRLVKNQK